MTSKEFKIQKRYTKSIKLSDGSIQSFATELETMICVGSAEEFVAESNKLFEQCRFLVEEDIKKTLGG
jgi:hypothetical protein